MNSCMPFSAVEIHVFQRSPTGHPSHSTAAALTLLLLVVVVVVILVVHLAQHCLFFFLLLSRFLLFCQDLQVAVKAESCNVTNDAHPDDNIAWKSRQFVDLQEWQQQSEEDQGCFVEVATESRCRRRQCVHNGELDDVVD